MEAYGLLAALLRSPPQSDLLSLLASVANPTPAQGRQTALESAWHAVAEAAAAADEAAVEKEFQDLFIGIGRGELLPYGSWYLKGVLMDKSLAALRADLARLGLARAEGVSEPEDHAAALCETMVLLADPQCGLDMAGQQQFFAEHVGSWMPRFFQELQGAKRADFYVSVGRLGEAFMEFEKVWLNLPE